MSTWEPSEFGQAWAGVYDEVYRDLQADTEAATAYLTARLTPGARLLELGTGTGRLAIPLAQAGLQVVGLDASARMLEQLRAKPDGDLVTTLLGDMTDPAVEGPVDCVLIAFNTLFALSTQAAQIACLSACRRLLAADGELVVDLAVPQPWRLDGAGDGGGGGGDRGGGGLSGGEMMGGQVALEVGDHDPVTQTIRSAKVLITDSAGIRTLPLKMRYAYPPELDLMARLAGLQLVSRTAGWDDAPFDRNATRHISVYRAQPPQDPRQPRHDPRQPLHDPRPVPDDTQDT